MQRLEVSCAVRRIYTSLGAKVLNIVSVCLYSCISYATCKSHLRCVVLHSHLWSVRLHHIFHTLSPKRHDFRAGNCPTKKCVFWFSLQLLPGTSHSNEISTRYDHKFTQVLMFYSCQISMIQQNVKDPKRQISEPTFSSFYVQTTKNQRLLHAIKYCVISITYCILYVLYCIVMVTLS